MTMNKSEITDSHEWFKVSAEDVLLGHPDRICDGIAEFIVSYACRTDPAALVGVEVAIHRSMVMITGRVAAHNTRLGGAIELPQDALEYIVSEVLMAAGYVGLWEHNPTVLTDLDVGDLSDEERSIRGLSDDQGIAVGYATPFTKTGIPLEAELARACKKALARTQAANHEVLGPDGKVLVTLASDERTIRLDHVNVSIQHIQGLGFSDLYDLVLPGIRRALNRSGIKEPPNSDWLRLNGIGDFTCGGPMGDNGLSGKKLVVDHYGPQVPIGGGAICGKDVHKPDRVGALRSRQVASRLATVTNQPATVTLGFLPGLEEPDRLNAVLRDGTKLSRSEISKLIDLPDLSLAGTVLDLDLAAHYWYKVMRDGYFGNETLGWER
jgi:S-adenosylmethionine synthetase